MDRLNAALAELSTEATAGQQQGLWLQNARLFMLERNYEDMTHWIAQVDAIAVPEKEHAQSASH